MIVQRQKRQRICFTQNRESWTIYNKSWWKVNNHFLFLAVTSTCFACACRSYLPAQQVVAVISSFFTIFSIKRGGALYTWVWGLSVCSFGLLVRDGLFFPKVVSVCEWNLPKAPVVWTMQFMSRHCSKEWGSSPSNAVGRGAGYVV